MTAVTKPTPESPAKPAATKKAVAPVTPKAVTPKAKAASTKAAARAEAAVKEAKPKKPKLVRDSFTIPKDEYAVVEVLKQRTTKQGHIAKKSELLRAGLKLLAQLDDAALLSAMQAVPSIKTGRPQKAEKTADKAVEKVTEKTATKPATKKA